MVRRRLGALTVKLGFGLAQVPVVSEQPTAAPPATDIYLVSIGAGLQSMSASAPSPASVAPGYDNSRCSALTAAGSCLPRTAMASKSTSFNLTAPPRKSRGSATHRRTRIRRPSCPQAGGPVGGFRVVRTEPDKTQRLWRFDAGGDYPQVLLADVKPVGYHAWIDANTVALFVLGPPSTLRIANVAIGQADIAAKNIGRSLQSIPGRHSAGFVHQEKPSEFLIKQIDVASKKMSPWSRQ